MMLKRKFIHGIFLKGINFKEEFIVDNDNDMSFQFGDIAK